IALPVSPIPDTQLEGLEPMPWTISQRNSVYALALAEFWACIFCRPVVRVTDPEYIARLFLSVRAKGERTPVAFAEFWAIRPAEFCVCISPRRVLGMHLLPSR